MADYGHYPDSGTEFNDNRKPFADSQEAAFRKNVRAMVKAGPFTKSERDVALAFFNHWLHHRNGAKGYVHPGREKLAKKAGVTIRTVSRCLDMLRESGAIVATAHLEGLHGKATQYVVNMPALAELCGAKKSDRRINGGTNVPARGRDKMSRRLNDVSNVIPFAKRAV